jgi:broad specificity phosphatase PhoE
MAFATLARSRASSLLGTAAATGGFQWKVATRTHSSLSSSLGCTFAASLPPLEPNHRRVYLLRHGQTDWNARGLMQGGGYDIELNESGRTQARRVAQELSSIPLDIVASSHLSRAAETADIVHEVQRQTHSSSSQTTTTLRTTTTTTTTLERLRSERFGEMRFGKFEGAAIHGEECDQESHDKFWEVNYRIRADTSIRFPPDGESTDDVEERSRMALEAILDKYPDANHIAIVGHGRANQILLASILWNDVQRCHEIEQGNTCINALDFSETTETWNPLILNYTEHTKN